MKQEGESRELTPEEKWLESNDPGEILLTINDVGIQEDTKRKLLKFAFESCERFNFTQDKSLEIDFKILKNYFKESAGIKNIEKARGDVELVANSIYMTGDEEEGIDIYQAHVAIDHLARMLLYDDIFAQQTTHFIFSARNAVAGQGVKNIEEIDPQKLQEEKKFQADLLRDTLGNPYHRFSEINPDWLKWNSGVIGAMAESICQEGKFEDMPILADALEDAGCTDTEILNHCRNGKPHFKSCCVLDLILKNK